MGTINGICGHGLFSPCQRGGQHAVLSRRQPSFQPSRDFCDFQSVGLGVVQMHNTDFTCTQWTVVPFPRIGSFCSQQQPLVDCCGINVQDVGQRVCPRHGR